MNYNINVNNRIPIFNSNLLWLNLINNIYDKISIKKIGKFYSFRLNILLKKVIE